MSFMDGLRAQAAARPRRVLLPESHDPRVIDAAAQLVSNQLATPILLSRPPAPIKGVESFVDLPDVARWNAQIDETIAGLLAKKGESEIEAAKSEPLMRAAVLLRLGFADA